MRMKISKLEMTAANFQNAEWIKLQKSRQRKLFLESQNFKLKERYNNEKTLKGQNS